jgi:predicted transposase/invertase (TIGR01784 family)
METEYFHHYKIVNIKHTQKQIQGLEMIFIELPKFKALNRAEKRLHDLWLRFLTEVNENTEKVSEDLLSNEEIKEAVGYVEKAAYTKEELFAYDKWLIDIMTAQGMLDEALEKGLEKGEAKNQIKIVLNCFRAGYKIEDIAIITELSIEQVTEILKQHGLEININIQNN